MKISTESKVEYTTYYECENCGAKHIWDGNIGHCAICGKEICNTCSDVEFEIIDADNLGFTSHADSTYYNVYTNDKYTRYHVCSKCSRTQLKKLQNKYDKSVAKLVEKFNKDLDKLNKTYQVKLKGI